jgi:hypothetical protein
MAEFSRSGRVVKAAIGPVLLCGWWYFAPYWTFVFFFVFFLTIRQTVLAAGYLLLVLPLLYQTISWWYEAWTGREATEAKEVDDDIRRLDRLFDHVADHFSSCCTWLCPYAAAKRLRRMGCIGVANDGC